MTKMEPKMERRYQDGSERSRWKGETKEEKISLQIDGIEAIREESWTSKRDVIAKDEPNNCKEVKVDCIYQENRLVVRVLIILIINLNSSDLC